MSLRILIATHSILSPEFGAAQVAINLAEALREQGHDVTLWSPHPMPIANRWWQSFQSMNLGRSKLNAFIETQDPFDVIDCYASLITKQVSKSATLTIARSVQPDVLYLASNLNNSPKRNLKDVLLLPFNCSVLMTNLFLVLQGWRRANYILCLGSLELQWLEKWFPWWRSKLISYVNALSEVDQVALASVRLRRKEPEGEGIRFLWIGRWVAHKGIAELVDFIVERAASHPEDTFTIAGCDINVENDFPLELIRSSRLKILPFFKRHQLYDLLANHDIGLFPSRVEGWGLVLNEMLESGMPVFATPVGGVIDLKPFFEEMLNPFPPSPQLNALGLKSLISAEVYYKDYYNKFSWNSIAQSYVDTILNHLQRS